MIVYSLNAVGSPPRVRGKVHEVFLCIKFTRITPACAGKRLSETLKKITRQDHPRVCGEKKGGLRVVSQNGGSPPRVRGKARL